MRNKQQAAGQKGGQARGQRRKQTQGGTPQRRSGGRNPRRRHGSTVGAKRSAPVEEKSREGLRINKYLADAGVASRRKAEELIEQGAVRINRKIVKDLATRIFPGDFVTVNGNPINAEKHLTYILLNKPKDCISTSRDELGRRTVFDIIRSKERLYTVGRLDRNTTGVLLITNDGDMAHRLMHPSYQVERVYNVGIDKPLDLKDAAQIARGVELEDGTTQPCEVLLDPGDRSKIRLQIAEGRNREIRRIFEKLGYVVRKLDRKVYGTLTNKGMARGEYRHLTRDEVRKLEALVGLGKRF